MHKFCYFDSDPSDRSVVDWIVEKVDQKCIIGGTLELQVHIRTFNKNGIF
jgi:hypothetical protein